MHFATVMIMFQLSTVHEIFAKCLFSKYTNYRLAAVTVFETHSVPMSTKCQGLCLKSGDRCVATNVIHTDNKVFICELILRTDGWGTEAHLVPDARGMASVRTGSATANLYIPNVSSLRGDSTEDTADGTDYMSSFASTDVDITSVFTSIHSADPTSGFAGNENVDPTFDLAITNAVGSTSNLPIPDYVGSTSVSATTDHVGFTPGFTTTDHVGSATIADAGFTFGIATTADAGSANGFEATEAAMFTTRPASDGSGISAVATTSAASTTAAVSTTATAAVSTTAAVPTTADFATTAAAPDNTRGDFILGVAVAKAAYSSTIAASRDALYPTVIATTDDAVAVSGALLHDATTEPESTVHQTESTTRATVIDPNIVCTFGLRYIRHPYDCSVYFHCDQGVGHRTVCPPSLVFNAYLVNVCDWPYNVDCTWVDPHWASSNGAD